MKKGDTRWLSDCFGFEKGRLGGTGKVVFFLMFRGSNAAAVYGWVSSKRRAIIEFKKHFKEKEGAPQS